MGKKRWLFGGLAVAAIGCAETPAEGGRAQTAHVPQHLCEVSEWNHDAVAGECEIGQKVVFVPNRWGNEQLPIFFAAVNCDLRFEVVLTNGGVTCVYGPIKPDASADDVDTEVPAGEQQR